MNDNNYDEFILQAIINKKYLSKMQKYMNFTKENLHVTINVTQKRLGVNENYARKISGVSPPK